MTELLNGDELTEYEKEQLALVMKRAKQFEIEEEKNLLRQRLEGHLLKFTNLVKGYQYRWFVLNPDTGTLEYYEKEEYKQNQRPRGCLFLMGATICPSDEDSQTFVVNAANGEIYRLKVPRRDPATDAKERQHWVNRLRAVAEYQNDRSTNNNLIQTECRPRASVDKTGKRSKNHHIMSGPTYSLSNLGLMVGPESHSSSSLRSLPATFNGSVVDKDPYKNVADLIMELNQDVQCINSDIDCLPYRGASFNAHDKDLLLMKATAKATISCLERCLYILRANRNMNSGANFIGPSSAPQTDRRPFADIDQSLPSVRKLSACSATSMGSAPDISGSSSVPISSNSSLPLPVLNMDVEPVVINHDEDVQDQEYYDEEELGSVEEHKSVILHMISQLKLGMDLTKVVLPTFILEKRSLLEMFADCMAHPQLFIRINDQPDAESRIIAVLQWYLTSFHAGRKGAIAKKPYNPIIGETFHCSWDVPSGTSLSTDLVGVSSSSNPTDTEVCHRLSYCAEQVSHHPPITAFYVECPDKKMFLNASIYTKSKFQGMSICAAMIGKLTLNLLNRDEEYIFTLPSVYARSILTVPWVELGDKISITCPKTKYSASVTFHTKPFYGGKLHKITSEVKNPFGGIIYKAQGEWNSIIEMENVIKSEHQTVDVNQLSTIRKKVAPLSKQRPQDSRRLWHHVTEALKCQDINKATQCKRELEQRQRISEKFRKDHKIPFPIKYFVKSGDSWVYKQPPPVTVASSDS